MRLPPPRTAATMKAGTLAKAPTPTRSQPTEAKPTATEKLVVPSAPPSLDEIRLTRPAPSDRDELASAGPTLPAIEEPAVPSDDTAARRKAKRRDERKVLDSLDAMRMLRRQ